VNISNLLKRFNFSDLKAKVLNLTNNPRKQQHYSTYTSTVYFPNKTPRHFIRTDDNYKTNDILKMRFLILVAYGLWLVDYGLWLVACGLWLVACGLWLVACGLWLVACGLWLVSRE